jgi:hypothetical protein
MMSRLRNRIRKADYFSDGELLRWPRDKRTTYSGLWAIAEDSGCLEDDPFMWKMLLWASPLDADITVELLTTWRDELVAAGKLIPYEAEGKPYLYIRTFLQHEHPRNPQRPDLPLPEWIRCDSVEGVAKDGKRWVRTQYTDTKYSVQGPNEVCTESVPAPQPRPAPSRVPKGTSGKGVGSSKPVDNSTVRPAAPGANGNGLPTCWRCNREISSDDLAEDRCVLSSKGLRHSECPS